MHQPKVEFNKKQIHQPKLDVQQRIKNLPKESQREREREFTFLCGKIWIEWKREKKIFIVNKIRRRRVKMKRRWRDKRIVRLRYWVVGK